MSKKIPSERPIEYSSIQNLDEKTSPKSILSKFAERMGLVLNVDRKEVDHTLWCGLKVKEFKDSGSTLLSDFRKAIYTATHTSIQIVDESGKSRKVYVSHMEKDFLTFLSAYGKKNASDPHKLLENIINNKEIPERAFIAGAKLLGKHGYSDEKIVAIQTGLKVYIVYINSALQEGGKAKVEAATAHIVDTETRTIERKDAALKTVHDYISGAAREKVVREEKQAFDVLELFHARVKESGGTTQAMRIFDSTSDRIVMEKVGNKDAVDSFSGFPSYLKGMQGAIADFGNLVRNRILYTDGKPDNMVLDPKTGSYRLIDFGGSAALPTDKEIDQLSLQQLERHFQKYIPPIQESSDVLHSLVHGFPITLKYNPKESTDPDGRRYNEFHELNQAVAKLRDPSTGLSELREILKKDPHFSEDTLPGLDKIQSKNELLSAASKAGIAQETLDQMEAKGKEIIKDHTHKIMDKYEKLLSYQLGVMIGWGIENPSKWQTEKSTGVESINMPFLLNKLDSQPNPPFSPTVKEALRNFLPKMLSTNPSERPKMAEIETFFGFLSTNGIKL